MPLLNRVQATFSMSTQTQITTAVCSPWLALMPHVHSPAPLFRHYASMIIPESTHVLVLLTLFRLCHSSIPHFMTHNKRVMNLQHGLLLN